MARDDEACPQDLLRHYREYGVLLCQKCEYAIQPRAVERHLKDIHRILRAARRPYVAYANRYELREPGEVTGLQVDRFPLPFLPVFDGLKCLEQGCHHLCVSTKRMQKHWLAQHERHGHAGADWQPAPLQTFFRGSLLQYFTAPTASPLRVREYRSSSTCCFKAGNMQANIRCN
jgi:hypothetical protein